MPTSALPQRFALPAAQRALRALLRVGGPIVLFGLALLWRSDWPLAPGDFVAPICAGAFWFLCDYVDMSPIVLHRDGLAGGSPLSRVTIPYPRIVGTPRLHHGRWTGDWLEVDVSSAQPWYRLDLSPGYRFRVSHLPRELQEELLAALIAALAQARTAVFTAQRPRTD